MSIESMIKAMQENRFTPEEKAAHRKILDNFNKLYYENEKQTWKNTRWRGVNIFKCPTDLWIYQELIHEIQPDLIIETGTCCGGSALYMADIMKMCGLDGTVISIDVDFSNVHIKTFECEKVKLIRGSSVEEGTIKYLKDYIELEECKKVMVILDSDHSKDHVVKELELYAPLVTSGSILIVEDTNVNGNPVRSDHGPGPKEALEEWWPYHLSEFELNTMCEKFMLTFNRGGYLERKINV